MRRNSKAIPRVLLLFSSKIREDTAAKDLLNGPHQDLLFHQKCYNNYTHPKTLQSLKSVEV